MPSEPAARGAAAEGLGGANVQGVGDPEARVGPGDASAPRRSDPEWVQRRGPEAGSKRLHEVAPEGLAGPPGAGVACDPTSNTVVVMEGSGVHGSGGGASTAEQPPAREVGGRSDLEARGAAGADTRAASADAKARGAARRERARAGTEGGERGGQPQQRDLA